MPRALDGHLSPGQLVALHLAASGYTSRQIAARLNTTEPAIHIRLSTAATSLGARSRTHAVVIALARGLLRLEELEVPGTGPRGPQQGREGASVPVSRPNSPNATRGPQRPQNGAQSLNAAPTTRKRTA
ncbi:response regulator transcription factor [Streptomyces sp. NPDC004532]